MCAAHATHGTKRLERLLSLCLIHSTKERLFIDRQIKGRWKHRTRRTLLLIDRPRSTGAADISHLSPDEHGSIPL
jgi:hypothetical protein